MDQAVTAQWTRFEVKHCRKAVVEAGGIHGFVCTAVAGGAIRGLVCRRAEFAGAGAGADLWIYFVDKQ